MWQQNDGSRTKRWSDRLANGLTWLLLTATAALVILFAAIAIDPAVPFNPYPPFTPTLPLPSPTHPRQVRSTATPVEPRFISPTPLHPATPTPTPEATMLFLAAVEQGAEVPGLDCTRPLLVGTVSDQEESPLTGYPVHIWGSNQDLIVLSGSAPAHGPSGWEVETAGGREWFVQLHLPDPRHAYPPLSGIIHIQLPAACPQVMIHFQQRP